MSPSWDSITLETPQLFLWLPPSGTLKWHPWRSASWAQTSPSPPTRTPLSFPSCVTPRELCSLCVPLFLILSTG